MRSLLLVAWLVGCGDSTSIGKPPLEEETVELFCRSDAGERHIEMDNDGCPGLSAHARWESDGCRGHGCVTTCCNVDECLQAAPSALDESEIACTDHVCRPTASFAQRVIEHRCD